jgi:ABC-type dipeptide/oligopeptide/nickel transport system ATPase component
MIAMTLAARPKVLIADEPTTGLDATIQSRVLDLLEEMKAELRTTTIVITHDMGVAKRLADRVAVMYAGRVVELGEGRRRRSSTAPMSQNTPMHTASSGPSPRSMTFGRGEGSV